MRRVLFFCLGLTLLGQSSLPPLREQASLQQEWVKLRLERVLPELMRKHDVAMWLVISREYNEDPVFFSLVSPTTFAARRRTIYVLFDRGPEKGVERLALGGNSQGGLFTVYRDPSVENRELLGDSQWKLLRKLIDERKPKNIGIDISQTHAFADGLSAGEREQLEEALGAENRAKLKRAELLALEYVETRLPEMLPKYRKLQENAHSLAGIKGTIYTHPIGDHGHGAGPLIGLWDRQQGVPGRGDVPLKPGTWFSIELSAKVPVPEWSGAEVFIGMEEEAYMRTDGKMEWVLRRQEQFHLVK